MDEEVAQMARGRFVVAGIVVDPVHFALFNADHPGTFDLLARNKRGVMDAIGLMNRCNNGFITRPHIGIGSVQSPFARSRVAGIKQLALQ